MGIVSMFNYVTLDGFFAGLNGDISWHNFSKDENEVAEDGLQSQNILLFGRVTYDLMASYWPTPEAQKNDPTIAAGMNKAEKIVFSKTLKKAEWNNTRVISGDIGEEVRKLKNAGKNMTILGSGTIVTQLSELGLIDEYAFMVNPVVLGAGRTLFEGIKKSPQFKIKSSKILSSGNVMLSYVVDNS
ncbi:dihydrofolate reductase family protein [Bdellovibrio sp. HCB2-146]|uniref:dihydrofolate reductase family protein n=1 Tax=Bdellovibrio sp. HCB2-146 TaxID=3394362 RepID=UPI0039BCAD23